jgi:plastocyanin
MRALQSCLVPVLAMAAIGTACGGGSDDGGVGPGPSVLTTVDVTPATTTLFSAAPGNTVAVTVTARDQQGQAMAGLGPPSYASEDAAVATVDGQGQITGVGGGTTRITASLTADGVTATGAATITVQVAPGTAAVAAPQFAYQPATADVSPGGTVTWTFGPIHHTVTFTSAGAPESIPELQNGSATRTFPNNGIFHYRCQFHAGMSGTVRVH